jgi:hypothetical protein
MTRSSSFNSLSTEFNEFLYAPIAEENNGMVLSVLSALARRGLDPWEQAAQWARLPDETAARNLATLIAALPAGPSERPDPGPLAARLIALLPRRPTLDPSPLQSAQLPLPSRASPSGHTTPGAVPTHSRGAAFVIFYLLVTAFLLCSQWIFGDHKAVLPLAATHTAAPLPAPTTSAPVPLPAPVSARPANPVPPATLMPPLPRP